MKYLKTYEKNWNDISDFSDYKIDYLLCTSSKENDFTVGKLYQTFNLNVYKNRVFQLIIKNDLNNIINMDAIVRFSKPDVIASFYRSIKFTRDKSMEEYILRKEIETYNL